MTLTFFWHFLFGIALFLYGIIHLEDSVKQVQVRSFKLLLKKYTKTRLRAIVSGTFLTSLLQSSSVVNLTLLSFVGAGTISLTNALGVILGSNIGGTCNSWLIALLGFNGLGIQALALPLVGISGIAMILLRNRKNYLQLVKISMGLGFLLFGLDYIKQSTQPLLEQLNIPAYLDNNLLIILLAGLAITAVVQTSAATVAIVLSSLYAHVIPLHAAIVVVLGAELGTTLKVVLASMNGIKAQKQLSFANVVFNTGSTLFGFIFLVPIVTFIKSIGFENPILILVFFQTFINVFSALIFAFFLNRFVSFLERYFKNKKEQVTLYIQNSVPGISAGIPELLEKEVLLFIRNVIALNLEVLGENVPVAEHTDSTFQGFKKNGQTRRIDNSEKYTLLKQAEGTVIDFYSKLDTNGISRDTMTQINQLMSALRSAMYSAKGMKDIKHNLQEFRNSGNDEKFNLYNLFCDQQKHFYLELLSILQDNSQPEILKRLGAIQATSEKDYTKRTQMTFERVTNSQLKEIEIATVFNISRELFSAGESALLAVKEGMLDASSANLAGNTSSPYGEAFQTENETA
ncbi:hypothetical protein CNR22_01615 [Sphingobacteriaceae bacterium]|nr:hypothetical protein CNR22_01615 [Sphingobacteriaceae bacterium]